MTVRHKNFSCWLVPALRHESSDDYLEGSMVISSAKLALLEDEPLAVGNRSAARCSECCLLQPGDPMDQTHALRSVIARCSQNLHQRTCR